MVPIPCLGACLRVRMPPEQQKLYLVSTRDSMTPMPGLRAILEHMDCLYQRKNSNCRSEAVQASFATKNTNLLTAYALPCMVLPSVAKTASTAPPSKVCAWYRMGESQGLSLSSGWSLASLASSMLPQSHFPLGRSWVGHVSGIRIAEFVWVILEIERMLSTNLVRPQIEASQRGVASCHRN
jgi:hypothetical protein